MSWLCRDCGEPGGGDPTPPDRCPQCRSPRMLRHPELHELGLAHIDCDAFYAAVEKRDNPKLKDVPLIIGGGRRGVVSTACYIARTFGIHSAMPMFKALRACPEAVVMRPNMEKYAVVAREVRALMKETTPLIEPLSLDEAFLDLHGTERLHGRSPAGTMAKLAQRLEAEIGISASIGLSYNKFLAKVASELDKPRGFSVIGRADALDFLADKPVGIIWGVGKSLRNRLAKDGLVTVRQLRALPEEALIARYGSMGRRLARFALGQDDRRVEPNAPTKSISAETTLNEDIAARERLNGIVWPLCEKVSARLKRAELAAGGVTLKLKTAEFKLLTRSRKLSRPTQLAEVIYQQILPLLAVEADGRKFRLIGVGSYDLGPPRIDEDQDLLDADAGRRAKVERAIDSVRDKLGRDAIRKGRGWSGPELSSRTRKDR